jgi:hypothetical protein
VRRLRSLFDHEFCAHCRLRRLAIRALGDRPHVPAVASRQQGAGAARLPPTTGKFESGFVHTRSEDALCALEELELICLCVRRGHPDERLPRNFRRVNRGGSRGCRRGDDGIIGPGRRGRSRLGGCPDRWGDGGCDRLSPLRTSGGETLTTDEQRKQNAEREDPDSGREQTNSDAAARRWELDSPLETARQALDHGGLRGDGNRPRWVRQPLPRCARELGVDHCQLRADGPEVRLYGGRFVAQRDDAAAGRDLIGRPKTIRRFRGHSRKPFRRGCMCRRTWNS